MLRRNVERMDASRYLRLRVQEQGKYIHKSTYMDAGLRTQYVTEKVETLTPVAAQTSRFECSDGSGCSDSVRLGVSSCCRLYEDPMTITGIRIPCCPMQFISSVTVPPCKYEFCSTPAQYKEAVANRTCNKNCS